MELIKDREEHIGRGVVGLCQMMCPEAEMELREAARLIHPLEVEEVSCSSCTGRSCATFNSARSGSTECVLCEGVNNLKISPCKSEIGTFQKRRGQQMRADRKRMVKAYRRPAAGRNENDPRQLRPFPVLKTTVAYLTEQIGNDDNFEWSDVYDFVSDRLRAVRQDMIIQILPPNETAELLEPMIMFYLVASYRCETNFCPTYERKLHYSQFEECLSRLKTAYSEQHPDRLNEQDTTVFQQIDLIYRALDYRSVEHLFLWRKHYLNGKEESWELCAQVMASIRMNNVLRFFRIFKKLPKFLQLAAWTHVGQMRSHGLKLLGRCFSVKKSILISADVAQKWMEFDSIEDFADSCLLFGLEVSGDQLVRCRNDTTPQPKDSSRFSLNRCDKTINL